VKRDPVAPGPPRGPHPGRISLVAQSRAASLHVAEWAARRGLHLEIEIAPASAPDAWISISRRCLERSGQGGPLLVALHAPARLGDLLELARHAPGSALLLSGPAARRLRGWPSASAPGAPLPTARAVCEALGLAVLRTPEDLVEAAPLLGAPTGSACPQGPLRALAADPQEKLLLEDALAAAGLAGCSRVEIATPRSRPSSGAGPVLLGRLVPRPLVRRFLATGTEPRVATRATLAALAALLERGPRLGPPGAVAGARPDAAPEEARAIRELDDWPAELHEAQVKRVLSALGLSIPLEDLVRSASSAGRISSELGVPVTVRAVGASLAARDLADAQVLGVGTASGTRQAFNDVLFACGRRTPPPSISGVLVSEELPPSDLLEGLVQWIAGLGPILTLAVRPLSGSRSRPRALRLPLAEDRAPLEAEALLGLGLSGPRGPLSRRELAGLADLLLRLSRAAVLLEGRLRWLHLEAVRPPFGRRPALVLSARALQTEAHRAPRWLDL
jgi:hypothetical protein